MENLDDIGSESGVVLRNKDKLARIFQNNMVHFLEHINIVLNSKKKIFKMMIDTSTIYERHLTKRSLNNDKTRYDIDKTECFTNEENAKLKLDFIIKTIEDKLVHTLLVV